MAVNKPQIQEILAKAIAHPNLSSILQQLSRQETANLILSLAIEGEPDSEVGVSLPTNTESALVGGEKASTEELAERLSMEFFRCLDEQGNSALLHELLEAFGISHQESPLVVAFVLQIIPQETVSFSGLGFLSRGETTTVNPFSQKVQAVHCPCPIPGRGPCCFL